MPEECYHILFGFTEEQPLALGNTYGINVYDKQAW